MSGTEGSGGSRLRRAHRVRQRKDFVRIQAGRPHGRSEHFLLFRSASFAPARDGGARLGITASKRVGNSVARNRVKRWAREVFRREQDRLPRGNDFVLIARSGAAELPGAEALSEIRTLLAGAAA